MMSNNNGQKKFLLEAAEHLVVHMPHTQNLTALTAAALAPMCRPGSTTVDIPHRSVELNNPHPTVGCLQCPGSEAVLHCNAVPPNAKTCDYSQHAPHQRRRPVANGCLLKGSNQLLVLRASLTVDPTLRLQHGACPPSQGSLLPSSNDPLQCTIREGITMRCGAAHILSLEGV